jgi:hypothetical protein
VISGRKFPKLRVEPKRSDTTASISASEIRRREASPGANDGDAIYAPFAARATAG